MKDRIISALSNDLSKEESLKLFKEFKSELNAGKIRSASPDSNSPTGWTVNTWVKQGILLGFKLGDIVDMSIDRSKQPFFDKDTYPVKQFAADSGVCS